MRKVADHSSVNMMVPSNLATVIGPNIIRPEIDTAETAQMTINANQYVLICFILSI